MTVVNYTPEQWQAAFERADDRALAWKERAEAAEARVAALEPIVSKIPQPQFARILRAVAAEQDEEKGHEAK